MTQDSSISRRRLLAIGGAGLLTSLAGCTSVTGVLQSPTEPSDDAKPPEPVVVDASAHVSNFRQTRTRSKTIVLIQNNGGIAEFEVTIRARGEVAVYDEVTTVFSLEEGQKHQLGFELFTHEGAEAIEIAITPTNFPELVLEHVITEEKTPEQIDYQAE